MAKKRETSIGWITTNLEDVCQICDKLRKPINSEERLKRISGRSQDELYPYYGATGLVGFIDDYLTDGDYVLLGEDAAPFLDYSKNVAYLINGKTWVNNHAHILLSYFDNKYLLHYLNHFNYRGFVSGTTRLKLTQSSMKRMPIKLAPLPEQRAIVSKIEELFSEIDNGISNLKEAKEKLIIYRQAVLKKAFEGGFGIIDYSKSWKKYKINEICDVVRGGSPRPAGDDRFYGGDIPFLKVADLTKNNEKYLSSYTYTIKEAGLKKTRFVEANTLLLTNSGATLGVPKICKFPTTFNDGVAAFLNLDVDRLLFLFYFLSSKTLELRGINQGAAQPNLNTNLIGNMTISIGPKGQMENIINEIESRLSVCDNALSNIEEALEKSKALKQSILKKAFDGELLSKQELEQCRLEADWEPAEKLLEKIKQEKKK